MILLGIPTCDTCRKARKALAAAGHSVTFRDIRKDPLSAAELAPLLAEFGDALVNQRSTTWRGLSAQERQADALGLLQAHPSLMKRPVCIDGATRTLGWDKVAQTVWDI